MIRAINVFPWDLAIEGIERGVDAIRQLECDTVLLSVNYHRARLFRPRQPGLGFHHRTHDWLDVDVDGAPPSLANPDPAARGVVLRIRDECRRRGLSFTANVIGCHNTTLGLERPDWTVENAFGNRYAFALCPANPEVRRYLETLVDGVCRKLAPDAVLLDSFSYLDAIHREHHELMFVSPGSAAEHMLSLCFCPHCTAGIDDVERVRAIARRLVESGVTTSSREFDREEQCALLFEFPELQAMEARRGQVVQSLLEAMGRIAETTGASLDCSSGLLARPCARGWTEGAALSVRAAVCRRVYIQSYFPSAASAVQDFEWAAAVTPAGRLILASMLGEWHVSSSDDLLRRVRYAVDAGAAGVSYYNYGLLNETRLGWMREANRVVAS
jgi:hypothetical protein